MGAASEGLARALAPPDGRPYYGSVAPPGSWTAFGELVNNAVAAAGWGGPVTGEELAAANWLAYGQWAV